MKCHGSGPWRVQPAEKTKQRPPGQTDGGRHARSSTPETWAGRRNGCERARRWRPTCRPPIWIHFVTSCARQRRELMGGAGSSICLSARMGALYELYLVGKSKRSDVLTIGAQSGYSDCRSRSRVPGPRRSVVSVSISCSWPLQRDGPPGRRGRGAAGNSLAALRRTPTRFDGLFAPRRVRIRRKNGVLSAERNGGQADLRAPAI